MVKLTVVPCAPVVEVKIKRPDTKYQLGFSVQNGVICSLLRGGIAERGGVRVGHRIIEINAQSVVAVPHERIVNLLATSVGEVSPSQTGRDDCGFDHFHFLALLGKKTKCDVVFRHLRSKVPNSGRKWSTEYLTLDTRLDILFFSILRLLLLALLASTATPMGREESTLSLKKGKHYELPVNT